MIGCQLKWVSPRDKNRADVREKTRGRKVVFGDKMGREEGFFEG